MTTAQPTPMASTSDIRSDRPAARAAAPEARARRWAGFGDNPMQTVLAAAVVGLLIFSFTALDNKIDKVDARLTDKIDKVEARLTARIDALDNKTGKVEAGLTARIEALDNKIDEINLKLTALITALGMAEIVDAAVEGGLPDAERADG